MAPDPDGGLVRLSVNLSPAVAGDTRDYARRKGVTVTEAVRRAITLLMFIDAVQSRGASLSVEEGGTRKDTVFLL
jgi:hypothetical protein